VIHFYALRLGVPVAPHVSAWVFLQHLNFRHDSFSCISRFARRVDSRIPFVSPRRVDSRVPLVSPRRVDSRVPLVSPRRMDSRSLISPRRVDARSRISPRRVNTRSHVPFISPRRVDARRDFRMPSSGSSQRTPRC
jgi:hypothetical protein